MKNPTPEFESNELPMRYLRNSNIPARHQENLSRAQNGDPLNIRQGKWLSALAAVREVIGTDGTVGLLGNRGSGKTQLGVTLVVECCLQRRLPALYWRLGDVFCAIRATYDTKGISEQTVISRLERCHLLVLDEAHERAGTDFEARTFTRLLDTRYQARLPTLLISNQTVEGFAESVGPSVADRIREDGKIIVAEWESFRALPGSVVTVIK